VHLLDTSGQEQYKAINERYYKKADCCLLVYDITNKFSFDECRDYYNKNLIEKCKKEVKVILLGNKTDLEDQRVIKSEEGAGFALENDYIFMETSCLKNTNVANAFETLIELTNIEAKRSNTNHFVIGKDNPAPPRKCVC
jgi:small GTP-binding protein